MTLSGVCTVLGNGGPEEAAQAASPAPGPLPCQYSNNSPEATPPKGYRLQRKGAIYSGTVGQAIRIGLEATEANEGIDREGRGWQLQDDGQTWERTFGGISSGEAKRAFQLRRNVEAFTSHYRHESCALLTLTTKDAQMTPREFGRIWDDIRKKRLRWITSYIRVLEAQKRGAPHYHFCVATPLDLKPGSFNWDAYAGAAEARRKGDLAEARAQTRLYAQSATPELREIWAELRSVCDSFGLGNRASECLPFRKEAGAVAHYIGKYLEGGLVYRRDTWKGARRVEADRKEARLWKRCSSSFGWVSPGAKAWRIRVGQLADAIGAEGPADLQRILGARWAYHARPDIMTASESEWRELLVYWCDEYSGKIQPRPLLTVGNEVRIWSEGYNHDNPF